MERKLLYLINPISGTKRKPLLRRTIEKLTTAQGIKFQIGETRSDGDYSGFKTMLLHEKFTDIIICGGDGSVSTVASYLLDTDINVGIIPTGSGNGLALAAGIPYETSAALKIIFSGHNSPIGP